MESTEKKSYLHIFRSGILWGLSGIFVKYLTGQGASSLLISCWRLIPAFFFLASVTIARYGFKSLKIDGRTMMFCALTGLEQHPQPGELPDSACEYVLPEQDIVFVTGSAFVNKTMPRLLTLCQNAETILLGPTVPLAPQLFDFGVDCLAGFVVTEPEACRRLAATGYELSPSPVGKRVRLSKEDAI